MLSIFFAGISGSSTADAASQGKIFIEAQVKEGYDLSFSVAITAVSAVLAVIIPPSILMIVWGGTLIGVDRRAVPRGHHSRAAARLRADGDRPRLREAAQLSQVPALDAEGSARRRWLISIPALMTPVIIIGGKIFGWFTATESAAIAVLYAGALSIFVYREMSGKQLHGALLDTGKLAAVALFCVGTASAFGWLLAYYQIPKALLAGVGVWGMGITATGFFIAFCFLVVGCFLDAIPAIIIVGTILEPLAARRAHGPGPFRDGRHHFAGVRAGDAAVRAVPDDLVRDRQGAHDVRHQGRHDHADADAWRALADDHVSPEIILFLPKLISPEFLK